MEIGDAYCSEVGRFKGSQIYLRCSWKLEKLLASAENGVFAPTTIEVKVLFNLFIGNLPFSVTAIILC
jgi:hypothetical protein